MKLQVSALLRTRVANVLKGSSLSWCKLTSSALLTNYYFYDCYWLQQFSYIFFWFSHQPRIICQHEITEFVMRPLKQLYACNLATNVWSNFECLPPANESKPCFLAESVKVHLALIYFLINQNYYLAQFYAGPEACKPTHVIYLALLSCILELGTLSQQ